MRPLVLAVLDGWGINTEEDANAIRKARTPNIDKLTASFPSTELRTSGNSVGLPPGQMGNSEVGHLTLGSGRVIYQELTRINKAIEDGSFYAFHALNSMLVNVKERGKALHLMGLLSDGGVHSHIRHLYALLELAKRRGLEKVYVHCFLDGRDTPPESGLGYVNALTSHMETLGVGRVATVMGRYYAMDRDRRWDRVESAYEAMVRGRGHKVDSPAEAVKKSYARGETDEFVEPSVVTSFGKPVATLWDGDAVLFFNFRADRARELTEALTSDDFIGFKRSEFPRVSTFLTMTEYDRTLKLPSLFAPQELKNILSDVLSANKVSQFRISETEKYAHVTFFFNGGREEPFDNEERLLIPSVKDVPTYDLAPEMRASEIAGAVVEKINSIGEGAGCGFILVNFANGDMVGHTGVMEAAIRACEAVDSAVGLITEAAREHGFALIITSDHGNAELMVDKSTGAPHTAHTTNPVPFILVDDERKGEKLRDGAGLADVAPTVLKVMGLPIPEDMEGTPIV